LQVNGFSITFLDESIIFGLLLFKRGLGINSHDGNFLVSLNLKFVCCGPSFINHSDSSSFDFVNDSCFLTFSLRDFSCSFSLSLLNGLFFLCGALNLILFFICLGTSNFLFELIHFSFVFSLLISQ